MAQLYINPYINFNGHAREAMEFYQAALGGQLDLLAFEANGAPKPAGEGDSIMHARLESDGAIIMGSDGMDDHPAAADPNMSIALGGSDTERLHGIFEALSAGAQVTKPLEKESWGDEFGMLTDKFGISWMVNVNQEQA